ncbi:hypothetical protein D3C78_1419920 [compost metagenome]
MLVYLKTSRSGCCFPIDLLEGIAGLIFPGSGNDERIADDPALDRLFPLPAMIRELMYRNLCRLRINNQLST